MAETKKIDIDILTEEIQKELIDFYEFLIKKYATKKVKDKKSFFESVKLHSFKLPEGYKFNREELYER